MRGCVIQRAIGEAPHRLQHFAARSDALSENPCVWAFAIKDRVYPELSVEDWMSDLKPWSISTAQRIAAPALGWRRDAGVELQPPLTFLARGALICEEPMMSGAGERPTQPPR
jgi:hypothetical protein